MTDATEWVTIRVPEPDRDDAKDIRPDDATYGDCLLAGAKALADGEDVVTPDGGTDAEELADAVAAKVATDVDARLSEITNRLDELEGGR